MVNQSFCCLSPLHTPDALAPVTMSWRKLENEKGYPFYFNDITKCKQWDHPKFLEIRQRIDDCNYVKYSKYRVAAKFQVLQRALYMEEISLDTVLGVFERHRLGVNESTLCLESYDLEAVLSDIFFAANKQNHTNIDVDFAVELMQNFLYNVFDKERQGKIQVSSTKLVLTILSNCELTQLHNSLFSFCADHNSCITRLRLQAMLGKLVEISNFMHEDVSFGQHLINSSVEECFSNSPGLVGLSESNFIMWLQSNPQLIGWIPILHRIKSSEFVIHPSKCSTCKTTPMMGLRYKCTKCLRYSQCQRCFFTGRTNSSHKLSHSMKEYCNESNTKFNFIVIKKICKLFRCSTTESVSLVEINNAPGTKNNILSKSSIENIEELTTPHGQLQVVIKQLEFQNRELQRILLLGNHNEKEIRKYLEDHKTQVANQIQKLKLLKECLNSEPKPNNTNPFESTPMIGLAHHPKRTGFDMLSPIIQIPESEAKTPTREEIVLPESMAYSINDISTWIKDQPTSSYKDRSQSQKSPVFERHNDLDDALAKLQQILANNFILDESLGNVDNNHLKHAVSEVEGMLTSFIDTVETSRASSVQTLSRNLETDK